MKWSFAAKSMALFVVSVVLLVLLSLSESLLLGVPIAVERMVGIILLVLPGIAGVVFGVLSVLRKESKHWVAISGILLNATFALFHLMVLTFSG